MLFQPAGRTSTDPLALISPSSLLLSSFLTPGQHQPLQPSCFLPRPLQPPFLFLLHQSPPVYFQLLQRSSSFPILRLAPPFPPLVVCNPVKCLQTLHFVFARNSPANPWCPKPLPAPEVLLFLSHVAANPSCGLLSSAAPSPSPIPPLSLPSSPVCIQSGARRGQVKGAYNPPPSSACAQGVP